MVEARPASLRRASYGLVQGGFIDMYVFITAAGQASSAFGFTFDKKVDAGAFLTFLTLVAGFTAWTYKTIREWRRDSRRDAENGALRLLLKILRVRYATDKGPIELKELRKEFESSGRKAERKAYCGREFRFKDEPHFERAIYQLQWEFKIDFAEGDRILFRTARTDPPRPRLHTEISPDVVLAAFKAALEETGEPNFYHSDLDRLGRLAVAARPSEAREVIEAAVHSAENDPSRLRALLSVASALSE
jgi:hypothetical protein